MNEVPQKVSWPTKFANAFRGLVVGVRGQNSFYVHIPAAICVIAAAEYCGLDQLRVCVLLMCIAVVLSCELLNTAIEKLAKAITDQHDERIRDALDIASAAVLLASIFAVAIAVIIFGF